MGCSEFLPHEESLPSRHRHANERLWYVLSTSHAILILTMSPSWVHNLRRNLPTCLSSQARAVRELCIPLKLPLQASLKYRYRMPAFVSSIIVIIAAFSIFIWALAKQGNGGPLFSNPEAVYGVGELKGSRLGWVMMRCITSGIGAWSGGVRNSSNLTTAYNRHSQDNTDPIPKWYVYLSQEVVSPFTTITSDFARYARKQGDQMFGQIFIIPVCLLGSNILGIVTTSCARGFYPDEPLLWYATRWNCHRSCIDVFLGNCTIFSRLYKDTGPQKPGLPFSSPRSRFSCLRCLSQ